MVNNMTMKKRWMMLITINQVWQYFNKFLLTNFLETCTEMAPKEQDYQYKKESTKLSLIKFWTILTDNSFRCKATNQVLSGFLAYPFKTRTPGW